MELISGLWVSVKLATIGLVLAVIITFFLFELMKKHIGISWMIEKLIKACEGMPLILIIPFIYYTVYISNMMIFGILILMVVGTGDLVIRVKRSAELLAMDMDDKKLSKLILVKSIGEWARLFKVTALFAIVGIAEFSRAAKYMMGRNGGTMVLGGALALYLLIHVIMSLLESKVMSKYILITNDEKLVLNE